MILESMLAEGRKLFWDGFSFDFNHFWNRFLDHFGIYVGSRLEVVSNVAPFTLERRVRHARVGNIMLRRTQAPIYIQA